jgi:predicted transcriptional regulator
MASIKDHVDDVHNKIIADMLKICIDGCTEQKIIEQTHLSHDQLRRIMAEVVDKELLHYIEARHVYITTDEGYVFLKKRDNF